MMQAAECEKAGAPVKIVERPIPPTPPKGVIVKILYSGVCHTDVHMQDGYVGMGGDKKLYVADLDGLEYPMVFGHEPAGVVHSIGAEVAQNCGLKVGDRVAVFPWIGCMECEECVSDNATLCDKPLAFIGAAYPGGFATHVPVPLAKHVIKIPDDFPLDVAALCACSGITAYNAVFNGAKPIIDQAVPYRSKVWLLIVGAGGLGLWATKLAKALLPSKARVAVADVSEEKLKTARENGADATVLWNPSESEATLIERTKAQLGQVTAAIDFVGNGVTNARAQAVLHKGGVLVCVGLFGGSFSLACPAVALDSQRVMGRYVGVLTDMAGVLETIAKNRISPIPITHHSLGEVDALLQRMREGKIRGRAVIKVADQ